MATIQNIITTIFNSQGAGGVNRDINTLARNQTRLGQSSASAGRAFSAQASGLGGLVAAYAGAAATTFALQQAFDKLAKSAQALQTLQGLNTLAAESAIGGQTLLKSIQDITKGQLTLFEAAAQTNLALSAGFDTSQIEGLTTVAIKASRALGRDLTDAMTRVVRGSAKMETELLDELGIYTKIDPATRAYAAAIGKAVTELSEYERRQAFVNGVIEEGSRKFSAINTTVPTAAEKIEAFGAKMSELSTIFLGFLAEGVAPLAEFLTNNFAASIGAVGAILSLVASKGVALLKAGFDALAVSALASGRAAENKIRIYLGVAEAAVKATVAIRDLNAANLRAAPADVARVSALQQEAKTRALTRREIQESARVISQSRAQLIAERDAARQVTRAWAAAKEAERVARASPAGQFGSTQFTARTAAIRAAVAEQRSLQAATDQARISLQTLGPAIIQQTRALNQLTSAAAGTRVALAGLASTAALAVSTVISRVGILAGAVIGFASKILFVVTTIQLFGSAIANFLGAGAEFESFFKNLGKTVSSAFGITKAREIKQTITGIIGGSLSEIEKTNAELANLDKFTFSQRKFFGIQIEVEKSKDDIVREVTSILQEVQAPVEKSTSDIALGAVQGAVAGASLGFLTGGPKGAVVGAVAGGIIGGITSAFSSTEVESAVSTFGEKIKAEYSSAFVNLNLGEEEQKSAIAAISVLRDRYGSAAAVDPQARAFLKTNEQLVLESAKYVKNLEQISTIMAATGQTAAVVSKNFNFSEAIAQVSTLRSATTEIAGTKISIAIETEAASKSFNDLLTNAVSESNKLTNRSLNLLTARVKRVNDSLLGNINEAIDILRGSDLDVYNFLRNVEAPTELKETVKILLQLPESINRIKQTDKILNLATSFTAVRGSVDSSNASLLRGVEILRAVQEGISSNSLDLEQFEQKIGSAGSAVSQARQNIVAANKQLEQLNNNLSTAPLTKDAREALEAQRDSLAEQLRILKEQIPNYERVYNLLKDQEKVLKSQIQLNDFIREQSPKALNPLSVALQAYTKDSDVAQAKTLEFISAVSASTRADGEYYSARVSAAKSLALTEDQIGNILRSTDTTSKNIVESLNKQAGIIAEEKDDHIFIQQTLENGVKLQATISKQTAQQVLNGQQYVELVSLQAKLAEQIAYQGITLLSSQDAYLSKLRETNALKQQELQLALATANEETRKQAASDGFERTQFNIDEARQAVKLEETRLQISEILSDTAVAALERQIELQTNIAAREQASLARKIEAEQRTLGIIQAQAEARELLVSIATPLDKQGSNEAAVFREQLNSRARILAQETVLLEMEAESERARIANDQDIAKLRISQSAEEARTARAQLDSRTKILDLELGLLRQEQQFEQAKLDEQLRANQAASTLAAQQSALKFDQLKAEQDLEIKKATDSANQLLAQLDVIERQKAVNDEFIKNYTAIVNILKDANLDTTTKLPDSSDIRSSLETFKSNVADTYTDVFQLQRNVLASEVATNAGRLASEKALLANKKVALTEYQAMVIELAEKQRSAEIAALQERLNAANQAYSEELLAYDDLIAAQSDLDENYNNKRAQLSYTFVNKVLSEYARIQQAGQQLITDFSAKIQDLDKETKRLGQEAITIKVKAEFDAKQAASQLQQQLAEADISRMQAEIRLTDARADIKEIPAIDAAKKVNDLQLRILAKQEEIEQIRFAREEARIQFETSQAIEEFVRVKSEIEAKRDLAIQEAQARTESVKNQAQVFAEFLTKNADVWNAAVERLQIALQTGANAIANAILTEGKSVGVVSSGSAISADVSGITNIADSAQAALETLKTSYTENAKAAIEVERQKTRAFIDLKSAESKANAATHKSNMENLGIQKQTEEALGKKRIQDAKDAGSKGSKEAEEAADKLVEAYKDITDKLKDATRAVTAEIINFVGGIITSIAQNKVTQLQAQETQIQDALSFATEKLNDVRGELEKSLDDETSQREQLIELTNALTESQREYIDSLGAQDKLIKETSNAYVEKLLEQKRAVIDLAATTRRSVALSKQEEVLAGSVMSLQESLDTATEARIRAEERLAQTQSILQGVTDLVNSSTQGLSESLLNMRSAMLALQEVLGMAGSAGIDVGQLQKASGLKRLFGDLSGSIKNFKEGLDGLAKSGRSFSAAQQSSITNLSAGAIALTNFIGAAQSGFGIGDAIAGALGKTGFATQIGGALGGVLGSALAGAVGTTGFLGGIATSISGAITGALGGGAIGGAIASAFFSFGIPIIGALLGSLFAKKPTSGAFGGFDEAGEFGITSTYQRGGASSKGISNVITDTFNSFFGSLEEIGVNLAEEAKTFQFILTTRKNTITAYFRDEGRGIDIVESVADAKEASKFFISSFLKTFRSGDLIVDGLLPFAENLQAAINNFASKAVSERSYESFKEATDFAIGFDDMLASLRGSAISTSDAITTIQQAAQANSSQLAIYYNRFFKETEKAFGESSEQYQSATRDVRRNMLAQIGLAEVTKDGTTNIVSLKEAVEEINAGAILVSDAISGIKASSEALKAAKFSDEEIAGIQATAIDVAITNLVTDINDSLTKGLGLLENPAMQAVYTVEQLIKNSGDRITTLQGSYEQLIAEGANSEQLAKQQDSIAKAAAISALELSNALETLSERELQAIIAAEELIDAQTRQQASARLAALQAAALAKAQVKLADLNRRILSSFTGISQFAGTATSVPDLLELFDRSKTDPFVDSIATMVNSIASGENILSNYSRLTDDLMLEYRSGKITADQLTNALELVNDTTIDTIETLESLVDEFEQVTKDLVDAYKEQMQAASSALDEIRTNISDLLDTFGEKTLEVLRIYDKTLASVAKSGNELFDLRDTAQEAFETASRAVLEFEESNRLSGRTSTQLLDQIQSIESQLAGLSAQPFDFASFVEFSRLSSQQQALKIEYKNLTKVEQEYARLLQERTGAQEDLAFATATIDSLSDKLIDVRRQESEIIQKVEDASKDFIKSQQDLEDITKLLSEANFNLNQIRSDETDAVYATVLALDEMYRSVSELKTLATELGSQDLIDQILKAYGVSLEVDTLTGETLAPDSTQQAIIDYLKGLEDATKSIVTTLEVNPIEKLSDSLKDAVLQVDIFSFEISDQFREFGRNLSDYIDLSLVTEQYQTSFQAFSDSLDITQYRFAILASSDGPLRNLNDYLVETYNAISILADQGVFLDLSFERLETAFGSILTVLGNNSEGLQGGLLSLNVVGEDLVTELSAVNSSVTTFKTQLGDVAVALEGITITSLSTFIESLDIDITPLDKVNSLVQAVNLIDVNIGTLNLSTVNSFATSISNFVTGLNSSVANLNLSALSEVSGKIANYITAIGDSTNVAISLELREQVVLEVFNYVYGVGNSIPSLAINTDLAESARALVETYVLGVGDGELTIDINSRLAKDAQQKINTYVQGVGDVDVIFDVSSELKNNAVNEIVSYVKTLGDATVELNVSGALKSEAIEKIESYVFSLGDANVEFNISSELESLVKRTVTSYVNAIGSITADFNINSGLKDSITTFVSEMVAGEGIVADFNISAGLGATVNTFINSLVAGAGITANFNISAGLGATINTFVSNLVAGTGIAVKFDAAAGMGAKVSTFVSNLVAGTGVSAKFDAAEGMGAKVSTFVSNLVAGTGIAVKFDAAAGMGAKVSTFVSNLVAGTGIAANFSTLTGLGSTINTFVSNLVAGTGITANFNTTAGMGAKVSTFVSNLVAGTGIAVKFDTAAGLGSTINTFVSNLVAGTGIAVKFDTTAGMGAKINTFVSNLVAGTGIAVKFDTAAGMGAKINTFVSNLVTGTGIAANFSTSAGMGAKINTFVSNLVAGTGIAANFSTSAGLGSKINTFVSNLVAGTGIAANFSASAGLGSTINTFVSNLVAGTGIAANFSTSAGLGSTINTFVSNLVAGTGITANFSTSAGLGSTINTFVSNLVAGTGIAANFSTLTGLGSTINTFVSNLVAGTGITANFNTTAGMGAKVSTFVSNLVAGTGIAVKFDAAAGMGAKVSTFVSNLVAGTGIAANFSTLTGLGSTINTFVSNLVAGTGITANFNTTAGMGAKVSTFVSNLVAGTGIAVKFDTAAGLGSTINTFVSDLVAGRDITADFTISSGLRSKINTYVGNLVAGRDITADFTISSGLRSMINTYVGDLVAGNGITADFTVSSGLKSTINTYVSDLVAGEGIPADFSIDTGLGSKVSTFVSDLVAGDGITATYNVGTANTLAKKLSDFISLVVKGDKIETTYNVGTENTLAKKLSDFTGKVVSGSGISATYNVGTENTLAKKLSDFTGKVVSGIGISAPYNVGTENTLAKKLSDFVKNVVDGTGITLAYSTSTLGSNLTAYIDSLKTGNNIALTYNTSDTNSLPGKLNQYLENLKTNIDTSLKGLSDIFDKVTTPISNLRNALAGIYETGTTNLETPGLIQAIWNLNNGNTGIAALSSRFTTLKDKLDEVGLGVTGTDGLTNTFDALRDKISKLKEDILEEWNDVVLSANGTSESSPGYVRVVGPSSSNDPNTALLSTIATNSQKYPKIENVKYTTTPGAFASGGYIAGPGTSTSDSIPARLSDGEYVLRASAVNRLGVDLLNQLNATGDISAALASSGRRGDSLVAHINAEEALALKRMGGSGTRNPRTGLLEFFNADAGAVGKIFAEQEADVLYNTVSDLKDIFKSVYSFGGSIFSNLAIKNQSGISVSNPISSAFLSKFESPLIKDTTNKFSGKIATLLDKTFSARDVNFSSLENYHQSMWDYGTGAQKLSISGNNKSASISDPIGSHKGTYSPQGNKVGMLEPFAPYFDKVANDYDNRFGQSLSLAANSILAGPAFGNANVPVSKNAIKEYIDSINENYGYFTDLYMLSPLSMDPISYNSAGGLVTRDRVQSLLEPGEFVLRKQAVDKMGLDNAIRLNGNGSVDNDVSIEVNVINNGTAQTPVSEPQIRRENGKIVVDVILEDLRNNGPIKQQLRTIR